MAAEAVAEVAERMKKPTWNANRWYNFACVYSLVSADVADKEKEYGDRAMELLLKAVKAGWDAGARMDAELDPIRDRKDFKKLLADLEKKSTARPGK